MTTYSTPSADLLFLGVKHGAKDIGIVHGQSAGTYKGKLLRYNLKNGNIYGSIPEGYSLLSAGTAEGITEDEAETITETVDYSESVHGYESNAEGYPVYDSGKDPDGTWKYLTSDPAESLLSLLRSLNLNPSETVVLYKLKN